MKTFMQNSYFTINSYIGNTLFCLILFQFYSTPALSASQSPGVVASQQYLYTNLAQFIVPAGPLPPDFSMAINHPFTNGFLASNNNYQAAMSLAGLDQIQNDTNFRYLKLYAGVKQTTSINLYLRINQSQYYVWVTSYLIIIDQLYDNSISITTYYSQVQTILNASSASFTGHVILFTPIVNIANCILKGYTSLIQLKALNTSFAFGYTVTLGITTANNISINIANLSPYDTFIEQVQLNIFVIDVQISKHSNSFITFSLGPSTASMVYSNNAYALHATSLFGGITYILHNIDVAGHQINFNISISDGTSVQLVASASVDSSAQQMIIFSSSGCSASFPYFYQVDLKCYDVCPTGTIQNQTLKKCIFYIEYCQTVSVNICSLCKTTFTQAANNLTCDCLNGQIITQTCINIPGCLNAQILNSVAVCLFCDLTKNFILVNYSCVCKDGFVNSSTSVCQDYCGDGKIFTAQCDDGNNINGDGCSSNCTLETGFSCTSSTSNGSVATTCKAQVNIALYLISTIKNPSQNSAIITFGIRNTLSILPLILQLNQIMTNLSNQIVFTRLESSSNQIILSFNYLKTVQNSPISFKFDFANTSYISKDFQMEFLLKGDVLPLKYSSFMETYNNIESANYLNGIVGLLVLLIALPAPKFIGVETIETLQLYFYSLLLIPMELWTPAFQTLLPLKYCNGYAISLFNQNRYSFLTQNQNSLNKFQTLEFFYIFLNNTNIILSIFFGMFFIFLVYAIYQKNLEKTLLQQQIRQKNTIQNQQNKQKYLQTIEKSQKIYKFVLHFAFFILFSSITGIYIQAISPIEIRLATQSILQNAFQSFNTFIIVLTFACLVSIFLNNFLNLFLTDVRLKNVHYRYQNKQLLHVKLNIAYMLMMAALIIVLNNQKLISSCILSVFVLIVEVIYIVLLLIVKPYKLCVRVHSFALLFNHLSLAVFFIFILIFNFFQIKNELIDVIFAYYVLFTCFLVSVLTVVRLYYQYRYGNELDQKIKKEDQKRHEHKLLQAKIKEQKQIAQRIKKYEKQAKKKSLTQGPNPNKNQLFSKKNKYLIQNQMEEEEQINLLQWLQKRINWTHQQKEKYYYSKFSEKPLVWLEKHDIQKYNKKMEKLQKENKIKQDAEQLIQIKLKLKEDLLRKRNIKRINEAK